VASRSGQGFGNGDRRALTTTDRAVLDPPSPMATTPLESLWSRPHRPGGIFGQLLGCNHLPPPWELSPTPTGATQAPDTSKSVARAAATTVGRDVGSHNGGHHGHGHNDDGHSRGHADTARSVLGGHRRRRGHSGGHIDRRPLAARRARTTAAVAGMAAGVGGHAGRQVVARPLAPRRWPNGLPARAPGQGVVPDSGRRAPQHPEQRSRNHAAQTVGWPTQTAGWPTQTTGWPTGGAVGRPTRCLLLLVTPRPPRPRTTAQPGWPLATQDALDRPVATSARWSRPTQILTGRARPAIDDVATTFALTAGSGRPSAGNRSRSSPSPRHRARPRSPRGSGGMVAGRSRSDVPSQARVRADRA